MKKISFIILIISTLLIPALAKEAFPEPSSTGRQPVSSAVEAPMEIPTPVAESPSTSGKEWVPPLWSVLGFAGMLLSLAIMPLVKGHWWQSNLHKGYVSIFFGIPLATYLLINAPMELERAMIEYVSFIVLLGSLFYISGGIFLKGNIEATPRNNLIFLAVGSLMASVAGTTGAAMLLIRPIIRANSERKHVAHTIIFFIFLVCNIGGSLTAVGDPPLFVGYLRGVPFTWTFNLWKEWLFAVGILLIIYYCFDKYQYNREEMRDIALDKKHRMPLSLKGKINLLWLLGVIAAIFFLTPQNIAGWLGPGASRYFLREIAMVLLAILSHYTTPHGVREAHSFSIDPIIEVAVIFAAIFVTMTPALLLLDARGGQLGIAKPWQFYWLTGGLSSFLDNTPTYIVFFELGKCVSAHGGPLVAGMPERILQAISVGAVFMGANTYIGNGPNFMVKAIAEENGIKMPSFIGYMAWSVGILIPIFIMVTFLFLL